MPRRNRPPRREVVPDPIYQNTVAGAFINVLMTRGKKSTAERVFYDCLDMVEKRAKKPGIEVFEQAIKNAMPLVEVKPRRVGGATYQVPVEVGPERAEALAIRWIIQYARAKKGMPMIERLAREFGDAYKGEGSSMKKREDTHKMAEANRAFAHYRW